MRITLVLGVLFLAFGCGSSNTPADMPSGQQDLTMAAGDMATGPQLTVNNTLDWCDVTVTVGSAAPVEFTNASHTFSVTAGTTVTLHAVPLPTFFPVKWTGVTTMSGADATYVTTGAATQSVTACCPTSAAGAGC